MRVQPIDWYAAEFQCVLYFAAFNQVVMDAWSSMLNKELFGLLDVVAMIVDIHLAL